ncbi:MAG: hypothetical protein J6W24_06065 [Prevotella sp.]|nr:hypothetical protein [Prevotella sp.]
MRFDTNVLDTFIRKIYGGFDTQNEIERTMWQEVLRIINEATVEGLMQAKEPPTHDKLFYQALRHSNEVFAAFKVHTMGEEMAAKLRDGSGHLKPFSQWKDDISSIASHQCGAWLRTEYDTAVIRAHAAADWKEYERNKDVLPNLRWMKTTSPNPEGHHRQYWEKGLCLPVDDPFWIEHHPGDRWNCKCSLEPTDDPVVLPDDMEPTTPQRGLENNPGKDGHLFNDTHPYFPNSCYSCPFNKGLNNKVQTFLNSGGKHCQSCGKVNKKLPSEKANTGILSALELLKELKGANFGKQLRAIIGMKDFKPLKKHKGVFTTGGERGEDYKNLVNGADKAVAHGYDVYILPNPKGIKTADYIFVRKGICKMYDLKTIAGKGSIGTRLEESIGQTNRVYLNLATTYPTNRMAMEIKHYFETSRDAQEVLIAVGKKMVSVERYMISERNFYKEFRKRIEQ